MSCILLQISEPQHVLYVALIVILSVVSEFQRDDWAEVYIIVMLSGHKAGNEAGRDGDLKKQTTDSCAELCTTTESGCGLSAGLRCGCGICKSRE